MTQGHPMSRRDFTLTALSSLAAAGALPAQALAAAGPRWQRAKLDAAIGTARKNQIAALIVSHRGKTIVSHGEVGRPFFLHSMRKSVISALYGIAADKGQINLDASLEEIGIARDAQLTPAEGKATLRHLLQARSGVYLPAAAESPPMKAKRPARGSHAPGTFWYYNNWDFNVLGHAYERLTGKDVFIGFQHELARPLGMQDFNIFEHSFHSYEPDAPLFSAYHLILSARDLLKFGHLFLQGGAWQGKQLISPGWVKESTRSVSRTDYPDAMSGYGYLWWVASGESATGPAAIPSDSYTAAGAGGHFVTIMPQLETVVVVRVDTFSSAVRSPIASPKNYSMLLREIIAAHPRQA